MQYDTNVWHSIEQKKINERTDDTENFEKKISLYVMSPGYWHSSYWDYPAIQRGHDFELPRYTNE